MSSLQSSEGTQVNEGAEAFSKLESEIGELVRRDTTAPRLQQGNDDELNVGSLVNTQVNDGVDVFSKLEGEIREHVGSVMQKVSGTSVQEVENLIAELQILRGKLQNEAARVQREIRDYAVLIQGAKKSITTISGSLSFWKDRDAPKISA
jgi:hypothetical protein